MKIEFETTNEVKSTKFVKNFNGENFTKTQLQNLCKLRKIKYSSRMTMKDLASLIEENTGMPIAQIGKDYAGEYLEPMKNAYSLVRDYCKVYPLPLLEIKEPKLLKVANSMLPTYTGIEIECYPLNGEEYIASQRHSNGLYEVSNGVWGTRVKTEHVTMWNEIPELVDCSMDVRGDEIQFMLPKGIQGMVALYKATKYLKQHFGLNQSSGIHYHVNMTGYLSSLCVYTNELKFRNENKGWILKALDHWEYKGEYNDRDLALCKGNWIAIRPEMNTLEFRIGEMTFDYKTMMARIINAHNIARKLRSILERNYITVDNISSGIKSLW